MVCFCWSHQISCEELHDHESWRKSIKLVKIKWQNMGKIMVLLSFTQQIFACKKWSNVKYVFNSYGANESLCYMNQPSDSHKQPMKHKITASFFVETTNIKTKGKQFLTLNKWNTLKRIWNLNSLYKTKIKTILFFQHYPPYFNVRLPCYSLPVI